MEKESCYNYFLTKGNSGIKPIRTSFSKNFPDLIPLLDSYISSNPWVKNLTFSAQLYSFFKELKENPKCKNCYNSTDFKQLSFGFFEFCSAKCSSNFKGTREKCEKTCLEKYGHKNIAHGSQRKKIEQTFKKKYGGHPSQNEHVKSKRQKTFSEKFGCHPFASEVIKEKIKKSWIEKYGVENPMKVKWIQKQTVSTKYEKGVWIDWKNSPGLYDSFHEYKQAVKFYTEISYQENFYSINPRKLKREKDGFHLDHIFPVFEGWRNKIEPELIAHPKNLQMLWYRENQGKNHFTEMSVGGFYKMINCDLNDR